MIFDSISQPSLVNGYLFVLKTMSLFFITLDLRLQDNALFPLPGALGEGTAGINGCILFFKQWSH